MDEDIYGYIMLGVMVLSVVAIFIGCLAIRRGTTNWATKFMFIGSLLQLAGTLLMLLFIYAEATDAFTVNEFEFLGFSVAGLLLLGPILFFIGFFGFCARWGASGRRRAELREITSALAAAQSANSRN